jgi:hypothetical protein
VAGGAPSLVTLPTAHRHDVLKNPPQRRFFTASRLTSESPRLLVFNTRLCIRGISRPKLKTEAGNSPA